MHPLQQLSQLGKLKGENKIHSEVPDAFTGIVPAGHPFTCCTVFASILRKEFRPLYDMNGLCQRAVPDADDPPVGWSANSPLRGSAS